MTDFLQIIVGTPLPTILVLSGLFFMLLALVDKLIESISIPEQRRDLSLRVGMFLTAIGAAMWVLPSVLGPTQLTGGGTTAEHSSPGTTSPGTSATTDTTAGATTPSGQTGSTVDKDFYVQLVAVSSYTAADSAAKDNMVKHAAILEGLTPNIQGVDDPTHGRLHRVRFGPLTASEADVLCIKLKANGAKACKVMPAD